MNKTGKPRKDAVISFRTTEEIKQRIERERKRRKQSRSDFVETVFIAAFDLVAPVTVK